MKDLSRNITLLCGVCGNDSFETLDSQYESIKNAPDYIRLKCSDCGRIVTKKELIEENSVNINANIDIIKKDAVLEMEKEIKKTFKKKRR